MYWPALCISLWLVSHNRQDIWIKIDQSRAAERRVWVVDKIISMFVFPMSGQCQGNVVAWEHNSEGRGANWSELTPLFISR